MTQALHIERDPDAPGGYVVHYAIADVAAFVSPGDPVDVEANRRGETLYGAGSVLFKSVGTYNVIGTRAVNTTSGVSSVTPTPRATLRVWRSLNR